MKRRQPRSATSFEFSHPGIPGDELEQDRIMLEHNLQNLPNTNFNFSQGESDSVEYPRHGHSSFQDFNGGSFIQRSRTDEFTGDSHNAHGWSYRTVDDDEYEGAVSPYGNTMSTAAHHASALTLTAGLGGRGARRNRDLTGGEISISGAEYDPDRPLENMLNGGVDSKFSLFDLDPSRSKYSAPFDIDPLVVDSTAELDRILESGHAPPPTNQYSPSSSTSSNSPSDSEGGASRPKISDSLRHVSFSPNRPRVARSPHRRATNLSSPNPNSHSALRGHGPSPLARQVGEEDGRDIPTPKAATTRRQRINNSTPQPEVRLQPPTPSTSQSRSTSKPSRAERERERERPQTDPIYNQSVADSLYTNAEISSVAHDAPPALASKRASASPAAPKILHTPRSTITPRAAHNRSHSFNAPSLSQNHSYSKLHLPDITGLTSAVESPAKGALKGGVGLKQNYLYPYTGSAEPRDVEVRLLTVMNTIQDKLSHLEDENSISRRRVRELEYELEECKREVVRERTRVEKALAEQVHAQALASSSAQRNLGEREKELDQKEKELEKALAEAKRRMKGKARATARDTSIHMEGDASVRYKEVVEEKKALESLIATLRSHLTRLTSELSSHQQLLHQLFDLRENDLGDMRKLKEKGDEVERLRAEVERLAGEVEVLRGVVEEGLKERRAARERDSSRSNQSGELAPEPSQSRLEVEVEPDVGASAPETENDEGENDDEETSEEEEEELEAEEEDPNEEPEPFDPMSIPGSSRASIPPENLDKTVRTDRATIGTPGDRTARSTRFIDDEELQRIKEDVEDRRSDVSKSNMNSHFDSKILHPSGSFSRPETPIPVLVPSRPSAPTPSHATTHKKHMARQARDEAGLDELGREEEEEEEPFPQIRGERLEKLFFSAPDHDERTCTVCQRERGQASHHPGSRPRRHRRDRNPEQGNRDVHEQQDEEEDEGFAEGSEEPEMPLDPRERYARRLEKQRDPGLSHGTFGLERERRDGRREKGKDSYEKRRNLPQQTILARVIRELEDDFTHYKGVYVELADQYKDMDPVSDVPRRNLLARHLKEVVDILEQKGDQIASLYDLLTFKDKPDMPDISMLELDIGVAKSSIHPSRSAQAANALRAAGLGMKRHPTFS